MVTSAPLTTALPARVFLYTSTLPAMSTRSPKKRRRKATRSKPRAAKRKAIAPKRKPAKRKPAKRKAIAPKRKAPKRKTPKRKAPKRKAPKRLPIIDQDREAILSRLKVRSEASKKGWSKRRQKQKLIEMMRSHGWEEIEELPGGADLYEMMKWMADLYGETVGNMYQLAFGYKTIK